MKRIEAMRYHAEKCSQFWHQNYIGILFLRGSIIVFQEDTNTKTNYTEGTITDKKEYDTERESMV